MFLHHSQNFLFDNRALFLILHLLLMLVKGFSYFSHEALSYNWSPLRTKINNPSVNLQLTISYLYQHSNFFVDFINFYTVSFIFASLKLIKDSCCTNSRFLCTGGTKELCLLSTCSFVTYRRLGVPKLRFPSFLKLKFIQSYLLNILSKLLIN